MKIFISADIEGVTGIAHWDETEKGHLDYRYFAQQMTKEVKAACCGAIKAGAEEIVVKDAHDSGRNIILSELPKNTKIIRGWSGHPFSMVQELDKSFDALIFIGYHSSAGSNTNPLAHTMHASNVLEMKINGQKVSEFLLHSYTAASVGVPVVFLSGDKALTKEVKNLNKEIEVLATNEGIGNSSISIHPHKALEDIEILVEKALKKGLNLYKFDLPHEFILEIKYRNHYDAYKNSFYPGVEKVNERTIKFITDNYFDVMRAILFLT